MDPDGDTSEPGCCGASHELPESALAADVRVLSALGNATRYEALRIVAGSDDGVCVCELQPSLGVGQSAVSQALSRLYEAGLVTRRTEGRWRYYSATPLARRLTDTLDEVREREEES